MVPLNTALQSGQRIEIVTTKAGGPSRDWLNPAAGYLTTSRARLKVKRWFVAQDEAESMAQGRLVVMRELQRIGQKSGQKNGQKNSHKPTQANLDELAARLGLKNADAMFLAAARGAIGPRAIDIALHETSPANMPDEWPERHRRVGQAAGQQGILVVGVDKLLTQLGRCCKPMPPDPITGFVTRGKGVSIHRQECDNFRNMATRNPERVIACAWGTTVERVAYPSDILIEAADRQGLLRDVSDVLSRERINVTSARMNSKAGLARMRLTIELPDASTLKNALRWSSGVTAVASTLIVNASGAVPAAVARR
jgi:GTP pyrophosphokinase